MRGADGAADTTTQVVTTVVVVLNENWKHQYERLNRSLRLVRQLGEPTLMPQEIMNPRDVLYHFCCDALHLRDWIVAAFPLDEQSSLKVMENLIAMIRSSPDLAACADVALAIKHLVLTKGTS